MAVHVTPLPPAQVGEGTAGTYRDITTANHRAYARAWGYHYEVLTKPLAELDGTRWTDVRWHKSFLVARLLAGPGRAGQGDQGDQGFSHVFWTDCDALFMNRSVCGGLCGGCAVGCAVAVRWAVRWAVRRLRHALHG